MSSSKIGLLLGALLLAACPARAQAPGTYSSATSIDCNATPASVTITVARGQLVVAWAAADDTTSTFTFSDSASQVYTVATGPTIDTTLLVAGEMAYVANSAALTSVKVTGSVTGAACVLIVAAYSGMATSAALDVASSQDNPTASTTCSSPSITTTNAKDVIVGVCAAGTGTTLTAGGSGCASTSRGSQDDTVASVSALQDCNASATGTFSTAMTISVSGTSIGAVAAFKQAACPKTRLMMGAGC